MFEPHIVTFVNYFTTTLATTEDCTSSLVYNSISSMNNILELAVQVPQVCKFVNDALEIYLINYTCFRLCKRIHSRYLVS